MTDTLIIALVVSTVAPSIMAGISYFASRSTKREDWRRQDIVADRVAKAAQTLEANTTITSSKLDHLEVGQKQIHTLVNSNLTAEMEARYQATERELLGLHELVSLKRRLKVRPNPKTMVAIKSAEASLTDLSNQIEDRKASTVKANSDAHEKRVNGDWVNGNSPPKSDNNAAWVAGGSGGSGA